MANLSNDEIPVAPEVTNETLRERPDYVHLSDVFKYISHYRRRGHQIGRKVGDMLEVITLAALSLDANAKARLVLEPKLVGFSGAGHKVEFGLFHLNEKGEPLTDMSKLAGFVECKKVGVEQTIDDAFKRIFRKASHIPYGTSFDIRFAPRWAKATTFQITFERADNETRILIKSKGVDRHTAVVGNNERIIFGLTIDGEAFVLGNGQSLRDVPQSIRACRILEVEDHTDEGVFCLLNACLAGPQTPEKAKQASFVALDIRKGMFGQFDKRPNEMECVSVLVMTEYSHWEPKSVNMVKASIDYNLVVDDALIIKAMEAFENKFGEEFLGSITKETFLRSDSMQALVFRLIGDGRIFHDIEDGTYKRITVTHEGRLIVA
ncbi:MAG: hypothetical protein EPN75_08915 [Beijerinckiaceae bacterium]|nr:MAG: hypothetical protein EPN75_08915 [Beijerinckiaceae bacterium]